MKSREKAVVIENLSKKYNLGVISTKTLSGDISKLVKSVFGIEDNAEPLISRNRLDTYSSEKEVWALRNLSIDIKKGDVIGVVGKNGAGKSTLLKILSRITTPTHGTVRINGRVASLLEVGTGFHPELTGKENIYLNGAILGMKKFEIDQKLDEIVEFSGIKKYISTPVKRYSSGMRVRLAFSVAAHLEADILLVDEVLAVGDAEFQKKAIGKIKSVTNEKLRTVLFVSHNLGSIKQLCEKSILLKNGELIAFSDTSKIISTYLKDGLKEVHNTNLKAIKDRRGTGSVRFIQGEIQNNNGSNCQKFSVGDDINIYFSIKKKSFIPDYKVGVEISTEDGVRLCNIHNHDSNFNLDNCKESESIKLRIEDVRFYPGDYYVSLFLGGNNSTEMYDRLDNCFMFTIVDGGKYTSRPLRQTQGLYFLNPDWERYKD